MKRRLAVRLLLVTVIGTGITWFASHCPKSRRDWDTQLQPGMTCSQVERMLPLRAIDTGFASTSNSAVRRYTLEDGTVLDCMYLNEGSVIDVPCIGLVHGTRWVLSRYIVYCNGLSQCRLPKAAGDARLK